MATVSGIYKITNTMNGHFYIGSSTNVHRRKQRHFKYLKIGCHENRHLQNAYNKYGEGAFTFEIVTTVAKDHLLQEEQSLLDQHFGQPYFYNICNIAGSPSAPNRKKSITHRKRLSDSIKQYFSEHPEHREFLAELRRGKPLSETIKQKMRTSKKRGTQHHNSKLTDDIVYQIKLRYKPRECSFGQLAKEFGVDKKTIIRIIHNKTWTHVTINKH